MLFTTTITSRDKEITREIGCREEKRTHGLSTSPHCYQSVDAGFTLQLNCL